MPGGMGMGMGPGRRFYRETEEKPNITPALIRRIASNFRPYGWRLALMSAAIVVSSLLGLAPPILTREIIDVALPQKSLTKLALYVLLSFGTMLLLSLVSVGQGYLNTVLSKNIIRDLRTQMYDHLQHMPLKFFSDQKAGEINSRMNNDIGGIESVFSNTFIQILQSIFIFVTTAATLFCTNWMLALVSLLVVPLFVLPARTVGKARWSIASKTQEKLAELTTLVTETLNVSGSILVKLFTREDEKRREFETLNNEVTKLGIRETVIGRWFIMSIQTFVSVGPLLIYLAGGAILIRWHSITVGGIVMFVALLGRLYGPVGTLSNIHVDIIRSMALFERIYQYLDLKSDIVEKKDAAPLGKIRGEVTFEDVGFSYSGARQVLRDVSLRIRPGQMAALVGPSGAGKTTITYLLPRLYDASEGVIRIDGQDIREVTLRSLRGQIGMVTQDTYLFNASIRENLLFARRDATEEEMINACRTAAIHDFIAALPEGYDTVVGDRGIKLSGGEKQRLSIARTLLKNPAVVIFDEATSALDSESEALVQQALGPLLKGRTSLVIAHRLSTIVSADVIFVVENGRIAERGTHEQLLQADGLYRRLYETQFRAAAADASAGAPGA